MQEELLAKQKNLYMRFLDLEKVFNRIPMKVAELAMRKKGIPKAMDRAVMSLHTGAKTNLTVGTHLSKCKRLSAPGTNFITSVACHCN